MSALLTPSAGNAVEFPADSCCAGVADFAGLCRNLPESAELSPLSSLPAMGVSGLISVGRWFESNRRHQIYREYRNTRTHPPTMFSMTFDQHLQHGFVFG
jgi:hypothetical protein